MWCPQTIHPNIAVINKAINIESLPKIIHWLNLESISLIKPKAGIIGMWASGCPGDRDKCWNDNKSPPLDGSGEGRLKWRSEIIVVIHPAETGRLIINRMEVKNILQQ